MSTRQHKDWITSYLEYTDTSESPISYHMWGAISTISSALQRKVYMRWGHSTVYPNNYIILVGPSGLARKGEPIQISKWMCEELNLSLIGEDNTQEVVIQDIKSAETTFLDRTTNTHRFQSAVSCFCEELSVFTGYQNGTFLAYLTNWYDSRNKWTRRTKHQGTDEITGMCFNLLAATAPDWLPHILTREAVGGGFTSRCIFVVEDRKRKTVTNPNLNRPSRELRDSLVCDLERINMITGEYVFDDEALGAYEYWYEEQDKRLMAGDNIISEPALRGYVSRRPTHVKKIAMALTASRTDERVISLRDFEKAKKLLEFTEIKMPQVFGGLGKAKYAQETEQILQYIRSRGYVLKSELMKDFYRNVDNDGLEVIMGVLVSMKLVRLKPIPEEGETGYEYIGDAKDDNQLEG